MADEVEQIKERIGVAELLGEYLKLEKAGANYKALCPFHNEKTPSFMVNPDRNFWYCFGCQKGGDIFSFVQEMEGVDFPEALNRLADKAGVELPKYRPNLENERSGKQKTLEILELSTKVFEHFIQKHPKSPQIREYLSKRKLTEELVEKFRIGYAPAGWRTLLEYLLKKGYTLQEIAKTGLLVEKTRPMQNVQDGYDRFRDRIMFPIIDVSGRVVGFSARVAPGGDEEGAKYINTPETGVYEKSKVLYGLHQAKTDIRQKDFVIVVEGNMDVISSHLTEFENVVAVSGTALTSQQVRMIKRYTENIKLCFDMDEAGQRATQKSIQTCLLEGAEVEIILLPEGAKDVSDLVNANPSAWNKAVESSTPVMEYFFSSSLSKHDPDKLKDKKAIAKELLNVIKDIADPIEQSYWIKKLSLKIGIEEEVLTGILEKAKVKEGKKRTEEPKHNNIENKSKSRIDILEERLLGLFSIYSKELEEEAEKIDPGELGGQRGEMWKSLLEGDAKNYENELSRYSTMVKYSYDETNGFVENDIDYLAEWKSICDEIEKERKRKKLRMIGLDIKRAQEDGDEEAVGLLMEEFKKYSEDKDI